MIDSPTCLHDRPCEPPAVSIVPLSVLAEIRPNPAREEGKSPPDIASPAPLVQKDSAGPTAPSA
jgi:hypothetical protein